MDAVLRSSWLWFLAIGAGLLETVLVAAQDELPDGELITAVGARLAVSALALWAVLGLRAGNRAARLVLVIGLGGLGTLSLLIGPAEWLTDGRGPLEAYRAATGWDLAFAGSRLVHLAAVWSATGLMFTPSASRWFARLHPAAGPGVAVPSKPGRTT
jgi:hypothetical protein